MFTQPANFNVFKLFDALIQFKIVVILSSVNFAAKLFSISPKSNTFNWGCSPPFDVDVVADMIASCVCVDDVPSCVTAIENIATDGIAKYDATFVNIPSGKSLIRMFNEVAAVLLRLLLSTSFVLVDIMLVYRC